MNVEKQTLAQCLFLLNNFNKFIFGIKLYLSLIKQYFSKIWQLVIIIHNCFYSIPLAQKALAIMELKTVLPDVRILSNTRWDHIQKNSASLDMGKWKNKSYKLGVSGFTLAAGTQGRRQGTGMKSGDLHCFLMWVKKVIYLLWALHIYKERF